MDIQGLILAHAPRQTMAARLADISRPNVECFYFGYVQGAGHSFKARRGAWSRTDYNTEQVARAALGGALDGALCWNSKRERRGYDQRDETQGRAFRTCRGGWTAVAFWDRSGDPRGACNTAFIVRGDLTFSQIIRAAKHSWPQVWARFTFPIVEVDAQGRTLPAA